MLRIEKFCCLVREDVWGLVKVLTEIGLMDCLAARVYVLLDA